MHLVKLGPLSPPLISPTILITICLSTIFFPKFLPFNTDLKCLCVRFPHVHEFVSMLYIGLCLALGQFHACIDYKSLTLLFFRESLLFFLP